MTLSVVGLSSSVLDHDQIQGGSKQSKPIYDQDSLKPVMGFGDSTVEVMKPADDGDEGTPVRCYSCRCCDKMGMCVDTNCCYGIKCHVPDKPPDMCFFLPLACSCNSCPSS
ncbi:hypothetical protein Scep_023393 [Stephania cephalantha]|uniref:DUF7866 domain-containing protein n=1 Tax=Stephania cephalantha TaxID=152367 RepID=A0AAP0F041_9MAGN